MELGIIDLVFRNFVSDWSESDVGWAILSKN
jgi:hypothetical protein